MANCRYKANKMKTRVQNELRDDEYLAERIDNAVDKKARRAKRQRTVVKQSVEEFLAKGGAVTECPSGVACAPSTRFMRRKF